MLIVVAVALFFAIGSSTTDVPPIQPVPSLPHDYFWSQRWLLRIQVQKPKISVGILTQPRSTFLCIGINSILRPSGKNYVQLQLLALLRVLPSADGDDGSKIRIIVLDGSSGNKTREDLERFRMVAPNIQIIGRPAGRSYQPGSVGFIRNHILDYIATLEACQAYKPVYVLHLEDDVIPGPAFWASFTKLISQLHQLTVKHSSLSDGFITNWFAVRLFYSDKFTGYNIEDSKFFWSHSFSAVLVLVLIRFILHSLPVFKESKTFGIHQSVSLCIKILFSVRFLWFLLTRILGRQYFEKLPMETLLLADDSSTLPFCCTQAVLYQGGSLDPFITYLMSNVIIEGIAKNDVDHFFNVYSRRLWFHKTGSFVYTPSLFQHIGISSTIPGQEDRIQMSMSFEESLAGNFVDSADTQLSA
jgi:hypothetical protein